jgi:hypothetical protein
MINKSTSVRQNNVLGLFFAVEKMCAYCEVGTEFLYTNALFYALVVFLKM